MSKKETCERCGSEIQNDTAGGLCPRCLLALSFESQTMPEGERPDLQVSLSAEDMREHFPQFEILECLGRGGMGVVYKARQKALDRLVAIKVLAGERQGDVDFARRFEREAKLLAQMSHTNIVTVHDFGEADGLYYLVMEYVDGVNLRDLLQDESLDPQQALAIVPPVCEALEYAHDKGVVHRDIKPENLLLDREGRLKIADFGIATLVGAVGEKSGTPPYMAPEQKQGVVDRRADIYSLGAVLYEMLTGERPGQPIEPPSRKILIDVRLDEVVLRALEKEPARRYQTAREFQTEVEGLHAPVPVDVPLQPRFSRTAIVGAVWASFFVFFVFLGFGHVVNVGVAGFIATLLKIQAFILLPLGLTAPFGTTILGCVALTQIRRSAGRLYGLGLALFDALVFPLLALDALVGCLLLLFFHLLASWTDNTLQPTPANVLPSTLVTAIIIDILIVRWAWQVVRKPIGDQSPKGTASTTSPAWQRRPKFGLIIGLIISTLIVALIVAGIGLMSQFPKIDARLPIVGSGLVEDTPTGVDTTPEEPAPQAVTANRLLATQIEARLREAVEKNLHGNANNRGRREFVIFKSLAVNVSPDLRTATVHLTGLQPTETWPGGGLTRGVFQGGFDVNYAGGGTWEVTGTGGLAGRRFTVQTVDLMGIPPVDTTPEEVARDYLQASYGGDIERALGMIGGPLAETPKENAKWIRLHQVVGESPRDPPEPDEWHMEGAYAATCFDLPEPQVSLKVFLVLEDIRGTWKVVGGGASRPDLSPADNLATFKRFRSVNREDRNEVASEFVRAVRQGDFELASMLAGPPMNLDPSELARKYSDAGPGELGTGPGTPLRWHEEGPYAVTHVAFAADQPELVSYLALKRTEGIWRVVWADDSASDVPLADDLERFKQEQIAAGVMLEDLAMRFLVAIREKDEQTLRELCVDRTEGWTEALVGQFSMELRERFRQQTGEEFTLYPDPTQVRVDKDLAVVICRAFRDVQKKLGGNILVLHFCRTGLGWKVWTVRNAPEPQPIDEHLEQARKWAAQWDDEQDAADETN